MLKAHYKTPLTCKRSLEGTIAKSSYFTLVQCNTTDQFNGINVALIYHEWALTAVTNSVFIPCCLSVLLFQMHMLTRNKFIEVRRTLKHVEWYAEL